MANVAVMDSTRCDAICQIRDTVAAVSGSVTAVDEAGSAVGVGESDCGWSSAATTGLCAVGGLFFTADSGFGSVAVADSKAGVEFADDAAAVADAAGDGVVGLGLR